MLSRANNIFLRRVLSSVPKRNYITSNNGASNFGGARLTNQRWRTLRIPASSCYSTAQEAGTKSDVDATKDTKEDKETESKYDKLFDGVVGGKTAGGAAEQEVLADNEVEPEPYHSIIKDNECSTGDTDSHKFEADTSKLLHIVARSLYSDKEVFIRELISNASDSLEKLRYNQTMAAIEHDQTGGDTSSQLEIHIAVDEEKKTFTIQDTGIGMTKEQLIKNLGTIARSGSAEFMKELTTDDAIANAGVNKNLIGQFGVGFYSIFMVCDKVEVYSRSFDEEVGHCWTSDGIGSYTITNADNVQQGTKIILHLKGDCYDYSKDNTIRDIIKKYSNFVGAPIFLNGKLINTIQALWTMDAKDVTDDMHDEFYRFISNSFDKPRYNLHYKADAPLNIRALFYVPEYKPTLYDMSRETDVAVTLYSRKVMILAKANHILPRWLRFVKGIVDSEDIPLNLSRELLQDSSLIRKLRTVLTNRLLKYFIDRSKKDPEKYRHFYEDYSLFIREGIVTTPEQETREEIAKLLRFESSKQPAGQLVGLSDYTDSMTSSSPGGDRGNIYYLSAPSRQLAELSPYMEAVRQRDLEVLYCYEPYDELVLMNLAQFNGKTLKSIENETKEHDSEVGEANKQDLQKTDSEKDLSLSKEEGENLMSWLSMTLGNKIKDTKMTNRLHSHPCLITVAEMGAARHFLKTSLAGKSDEERYQILQPTLELNPKHAIIRKLHDLKSSNPELAKLVADQIFDNALIAAGLIEDPRTMLARLNEILTQTLEKH